MAKNMMNVMGGILILVGVIGFIQDPVLGIFEVNAAHNFVHLASGLLAIVFGNISESAARGYAKFFGIAYGLVAVWGLISSDSRVLGMSVNGADNWLHIALAVIFLWVGFSHAQVTARAQ